MQIVSFQTPVHILHQQGDIIFVPGNYYIMPTAIANMVNLWLQNDPKQKRAMHVVSLNDVIKPFAGSKTKPNKIIFFRAGGIGDILAMSTIIAFMQEVFEPNEIIFITLKQYLPLFKWYKTPVTAIDYLQPIGKFNSINKHTVNVGFSNIPEASNDSWYNQMFRAIGYHNNTADQNRPQLIEKRISGRKSNIAPGNSILLIPNASTPIRSVTLETLVLATSFITDCQIYAYKPADKKIHARIMHKYPFVKFIEAKTLEGHLLDLYDASLVISVDTGAIHFREGIKKPAIGIYGPFPFESRTNDYVYTKSFNIISNCETMPCYLHQTKKDQQCSLAEKLNYKPTEVAPCLNQKYNKTVILQVKNAIENGGYGC